MKPDEFWCLTSAEFEKMAKGYVARRNRRSNEMTTLAWTTAALAGQKKLPALNSLLIKDEKAIKKNKQSPESMMAVCKIINTSLGGKERQT